MINNELLFDPVVLRFEEIAEIDINKPIDAHTEYSLFTYINNIKYYLARGSRKYHTDDETKSYMLVLTSVRNNDVIKGDS